MTSAQQAERVLQLALSRGGDWADLFVEHTTKNRAEFSDRSTKTVSCSQLVGAGVRVVVSGREYYAYTNDLSPLGLERVARAVAEASCAHAAPRSINPLDVPRPGGQDQMPVASVEWQRKIELLRRADLACRQLSPQIAQVNVDYLDEVQEVVIANSDGLFVEDRRIRGRFRLTAVASDGQEKQAGYEAPGAHRGFEFFESLDIPAMAEEVGGTALRMLAAGYAPSGKMPVIIDSGFGGVLFHEACGHLLEAAAVAKKATVLAECLDKVIAAPCVSAVDDGTLAGEWGSTRLDDEGRPTQRNLLIENGILKSFLVDRLNGERVGLLPTGSSRRESYRFAPTSRMNNTYILPGPDTLEGMIAATEYGLYARKLGGGSVDPATGEFNFAVTEGYMIRQGKLAEPVRGAVLIGRGEDVLKKIDRVGRELKLAQGMCGASSGWVPVNVGQPAIRVSEILVGGMEGA